MQLRCGYRNATPARPHNLLQPPAHLGGVRLQVQHLWGPPLRRWNAAATEAAAAPASSPLALQQKVIAIYLEEIAVRGMLQRLRQPSEPLQPTIVAELVLLLFIFGV